MIRSFGTAYDSPIYAPEWKIKRAKQLQKQESRPTNATFSLVLATAKLKHEKLMTEMRKVKEKSDSRKGDAGEMSKGS